MSVYYYIYDSGDVTFRLCVPQERNGGDNCAEGFATAGKPDASLDTIERLPTSTPVFSQLVPFIWKYTVTILYIADKVISLK